MKKQLALTIIASIMTSAVFAAPTTVMEKTNAMETAVYGSAQEGAIVDRVNQLDDTVYGAQKGGTVSDKVDQLYASVVGEGNSISVRQELDVLEYTFQKEVTPGSMLDRLSRLERNVNGRVNTGSIESRISTLKTKINGSDVKLTNQIGTIAADHVFKVRLTDPVSTKTNQLGDSLGFVVAEDIMDGDVLLVPNGTPGTATITSLKKARSFGRNGNIDMAFNIPVMDGSEFTAVQGDEAKERTKGEIKAAGASVAGAVLLGPVGLVGGLFVKGKSVELPAGTEIYVQPQDVVTVQGIVIGGDGLDHSRDLTNAVVTPTVVDENVDAINGQAVDNVDTDSDLDNNVVADDASVDTSSTDDVSSEDSTSTEVADNVSQPIVVVKRN